MGYGVNQLTQREGGGGYTSFAGGGGDASPGSEKV